MRRARADQGGRGELECAMHLEPWAIAVACSIGFLCGISRTGIPGVGILLVPIAALILPTRESTGFLLPILIEADLMAVLYWRRKVVWPLLLRVAPWTVLGIGGGYLAMRLINDSLFKPLFGGLIVGIVALDLLRRWAKIEVPHHSPVFSAVTGLLAGTFSMMANAAGPVMTIYLLSLDIGKEEFVGTGAIFYWMLNLVKLPLSLSLGLVTWPGLQVDLMLIPLIAAGCVAGIFIVRKIPQAAFNTVAQLLAAAGGVKLLF